MSVINQMLRNLDARRAATDTSFVPPRGAAVTEAHRAARFSKLQVWSLIAALTALLIAFPLVKKNAPASDGYHIQPLALPARTAPPPRQADLRVELAASETVSALLAEMNSAAESVPVDTRQDVSAETLLESTTTTQSTGTTITVTPRQKADRLYAGALDALSAGDRQRGELQLREALFEHPGHQQTRIRLAGLLTENGDARAAARLLENGLAQGSNATLLIAPYARVLAELGEHAKALAVLDGSEASLRADADWHALRGGLLHRTGRHTEAALAYRKAVSLRPDEARWWTGLGVALEHDSQPRQALQAYHQAMRLPLAPAVRDYTKTRIEALHEYAGGT